MSDTNPNTDALDAAIAEYIAAGWDIHQATATGVQLKHVSGQSVYLTAAMAARGERPGMAEASVEVEQETEAEADEDEGGDEDETSSFIEARPALSLEQAVKKFTEAGWLVENEFEGSVNLKKPKQWSRAGLVLFVLLPIIAGLFVPVAWGGVVLGFLFVAVDYLLKKDKNLHLTATDAKKGLYPDPEGGSGSGPLILGAVILGIFLIWIISFFARY